MLSDDMLRFVFVYDARFADALSTVSNNFMQTMTSNNLNGHNAMALKEEQTGQDKNETFDINEQDDTWE